MHRRRVLGGLVAGSAVAVLAACAPKAKAPAGGLTKVRFVTDWRAQAEHGGFYQALASGEYRRRGLDVQIIPGGPGSNVPQLLASGAADLGMGSDNFIVLNLAKEHIPLKAVAAFFQKNPQVLIAHPDPKVKTLADLKGHPILLSAAARDTFWQWLKAKYGFTDDQIRAYNFNSGPFLSDPRAAQEGYLTSEPYTIEKAAGFKPTVFLLADDGYPSYATMVLARTDWISGKPEVIRQFIAASAIGWKQYLDGDPKAANAMILKDNPEMTQALIDQARTALKAHGMIDGGDAKTHGIGAMTDARWAEFFKVASDQGLYPKTMDYKQAYTLQFLK
jgi:NitT/TauT family transport system substrate-binding protein